MRIERVEDLLLRMIIGAAWSIVPMFVGHLSLFAFCEGLELSNADTGTILLPTGLMVFTVTVLIMIALGVVTLIRREIRGRATTSGLKKVYVPRHPLEW